MRSDHLITMMQPNNFSEFNPLDVLAAAASLQSARTGDDQSCDATGEVNGADEEAGDKDGEDELHCHHVVVCNGVAATEEVESVAADQPATTTTHIPNGRTHIDVDGEKVKVISSENGNRPIVTLKDATKLVLPSSAPGGKAFTVLRVNKQQMSDHSYAYICQLQNLKHEEDEGYSSRSSVDEEVEDPNSHLVTAIHSAGELSSPLESEKDSSGYAVLSPNSPNLDLSSKKQAKIVIVSKDSNIQQIISSPSDPKLYVNTPTGKTSGGNIVLRTLLGQKPLVSTAPKVPLNVTVRSVTSRQSDTLKAALTCPIPSNNPTIIVKRSEGPKTHEFLSPMSPPIHIPKPQTHIVKILSADKSIASSQSESTIENEPATQATTPKKETLPVKNDSEGGLAKDLDNSGKIDNTDVCACIEKTENNLVLDSLGTNFVTDSKDSSLLSVKAVRDSESLEQPEKPESAIVEEDPPILDCDNKEIIEENKFSTTHETDTEQENEKQDSPQNSDQPVCCEDADFVHKETPDTDSSLNDVDQTEAHLPTTVECDKESGVKENKTLQDDLNSENVCSVLTELKDCCKQDENIEKNEDFINTNPKPDQDCPEVSSTMDSSTTSSLKIETLDKTNEMNICDVKDSLPSDSNAKHNQYIIEDDVPPVTKFRTVASKAKPRMSLNGPTVPLDTAVTKVTDTIPKEVQSVASLDQKTVLTSASGKVIPSTKQSLLKGPVANKTVPTSGSVVHVIPMVAPSRRGMVAQVLPKTVQYLTAVPVPNKSVMRVVDPKVPAGTVLVPASIAPLPVPVSSAGTTRVQLVPAMPKSTGPTLSSSPILIPITSSVNCTDHSTPPSPVPESRNATPNSVSPIESTEESFKTLERRTPTSFVIGRSAPSTPDRSKPSESTSSEKINLKISACQISENNESVDNSEEVSKEKMNIGTLGSLSWKNVNNTGLIPLGSKANQREFIRIQGSQIQTGITPSECTTFKPDESERSASPWLRPDDGASMASATDDARSSRDSDESSCVDPSEDSNMSTSPPLIVKRKKKPDSNKSSRCSTPVWQNGSELHPLIDHDYCTFTEFNAQIQSSIIATTESKVKTERKYNKKTKAARTKIIPTPPIYQSKGSKVQVKGKRGRYKKKDAVHVADLKQQEIDSLELETDDREESLESQDQKKARVEKRPMSERRKALAEKEKKNYVKITGSYQDEFVYFATRNNRGRPRKAPVETNTEAQALPAKLPAVGGVNVFDWYRDMSKTDKSSYFGSPGVGDRSVDLTDSSPASPAVLKPLTSVPAKTPTHESEVVDLVCELSGMIPEANTEDLHSFMDSPEGTTEVVTTEESQPADLLDLNQMAEQVRNMLNSMGEAELQMLENLGDSSSSNQESSSSTQDRTTSTGLADTSFDGFLANFTPDSGPTLTQGTTNNLCDLDEINDNDLLATDIGNMNAILGELKSANGAVVSNPSKPPLSSSTPTLSEVKLDKTELFPDIHASNIPPSTDVTAPELTVVSMYWNDLPGLLINAREYVRLVDIHKQVLPAKDTGILKKRCQMMGLPITNCSELQRDFLIRYANAAKSKSTVIISKDAAKTLIGFYVHPKPRVRHNTGDERVAPPSEQKRPQGNCAEKKPIVESPSKAAPPGEEVKETPVIAMSEDSATKANRKRKRQPTGGSTDGSEQEVTLDIQGNAQHDVKRSERLKHKKVHYADMVNGTHVFDTNGDEVKIPTPEKVLLEGSPTRTKTSNRVCRQILQSKESGEDSEISSDHENRDLTSRPVYPEDAEIRKLKTKVHHKRLSKREARRLKRLKEKVQKKEMIRKLKEKKKIKLIEKQARLGQKSKRKLQETHAYTKKVNPEHCYAACPDDFKQKQQEAETVVKVEIKQETVEIKKEEIKEEITDDKIAQLEDIQKAEILEEAETEVKPAIKIEKPEVQVTQPKREPLELVHKDNISVNRNVRRSQDGNLHLDLYQSKDSPCIQCSTCLEFFTIKRFLKHMHRHNCPDELLEVALPQKLEMRTTKEGQQSLWDEFEKRQKQILESHDKELTKAKNSVGRTVEVDIKLRNNPAAKSLHPEVVTPVSSTRHSTRVRKRKQFHPIEKYVFSSKSSPNSETDAKRAKLDCEGELSELPTAEITADIDKVSVGVTPVRATKVKLNVKGDSKQVIAKYDLKIASNSDSCEVGKRSARVVAKRMRNQDSRATSQDQEES